MDKQSLGNGEIEVLGPLGGGTQNIILRLRRDGRDFVLRRGPANLRAKTNSALLREMRVLSALAASPVPHPAVIATCEDETVLGGAVFYLMEPVDGYNPSEQAPVGDRDRLRHIAFSSVDAIAALAAVDHVAVGLGDLGRPEGFLDRQVPQWLGQLERYRELDGYPGHDLPGVDRVADWLTANQPADRIPGIMHGDYHLANLLVSHESGDVAAVVDWEMSTIGDPLLDLGWLLATWPQEDQHLLLGDGVRALQGVVTRDELVARYEERSGRRVADAEWYVVLACFKLGIVIEGTHARATAGLMGKAVGDRMHAGAVGLLTQARSVAGV
nr:phosphotransferase family protein [Nocardioides daedukensis]